MTDEMKTCGEYQKLSVKDKNAEFLENQNCLALHRLPARSVLIPAEGRRVALRGKGFEVTVEDGMLSRFLHGGRELLRSPMRVNFWRAPIDNDGVMPMLPSVIMKLQWKP